jgi:hypothetical protein
VGALVTHHAVFRQAALRASVGKHNLTPEPRAELLQALVTTSRFVPRPDSSAKRLVLLNAGDMSEQRRGRPCLKARIVSSPPEELHCRRVFADLAPLNLIRNPRHAVMRAVAI